MGYRIREVREKKGLSQTELSQRSGITRQTIWKLETEDGAITTTDTLLKLAKAMDTTVGEIFFADVVQPIKPANDGGSNDAE